MFLTLPKKYGSIVLTCMFLAFQAKKKPYLKEKIDIVFNFTETRFKLLLIWKKTEDRVLTKVVLKKKRLHGFAKLSKKKNRKINFQIILIKFKDQC